MPLINKHASDMIIVGMHTELPLCCSGCLVTFLLPYTVLPFISLYKIGATVPAADAAPAAAAVPPTDAAVAAAVAAAALATCLLRIFFSFFFCCRVILLGGGSSVGVTVTAAGMAATGNPGRRPAVDTADIGSGRKRREILICGCRCCCCCCC